MNQSYQHVFFDDTPQRAPEPAPTVSPPINAGPNAYRLLCTSGLVMKTRIYHDGGEPRLRDSQLAQHVGYSSVEPIRSIIAALVAEDMEDGPATEILMRWGAEFDHAGAVRFWLTEAQVLNVLYRSETTIDSDVLDLMIHGFCMARAAFAEALAKEPAEPAAFGPASLDDLRRAMHRQIEPVPVAPVEVAPVSDFDGGPTPIEDPAELGLLYDVLETRLQNECGLFMLRCLSAERG